VICALHENRESGKGWEAGLTWVLHPKLRLMIGGLVAPVTGSYNAGGLLGTLAGVSVTLIAHAVSPGKVSDSVIGVTCLSYSASGGLARVRYRGVNAGLIAPRFGKRS